MAQVTLAYQHYLLCSAGFKLQPVFYSVPTGNTQAASHRCGREDPSTEESCSQQPPATSGTKSLSPESEVPHTLPAQSSASARPENAWLCLCFRAQGRQEDENKPFKRELGKTTISSPNPPGEKKD